MRAHGPMPRAAPHARSPVAIYPCGYEDRSWSAARRCDLAG